MGGRSSIRVVLGAGTFESDTGEGFAHTSQQTLQVADDLLGMNALNIHMSSPTHQAQGDTSVEAKKVFQILLAEDNHGDVLLVREALIESKIPHELHVVKDGAEAIEFVTRIGKPWHLTCPDLMLLDMNLPKADGIEVLETIRKHPECTATPVIMFTSSDWNNDRVRVAALGVKHYFTKPLEIDEYMKLGALVLEAVRPLASSPLGNGSRANDFSKTGT